MPELPRTAEVVVIGGGVNGLSTACQLTKRGLRDVVVLERRQLGAGASGKSGALVRAHYANPHESRLTMESMRIFRDWDAEIGYGSPGFEATGFLQVVASQDEVHLRANVADQQAMGIDTRVVSAAEIRDIEPLMRTDDITFAAYEPGSGFCDPNGTLYGFAGAAQAGGACIFEHTEALSIATEAGRVTGVRTADGFISTRVVVLAGGSWAKSLLEPLGVGLPMTPLRLQVAIFRWPHTIDQKRRHCVVIDSTHHSWLRVEGANSTLIGAEGNVKRTDPETLNEGVDPEYVFEAREALAARFPAFEHATMRGGWAGTIMASRDSHPIIDHIPGMEGFFLFAGDSGTSFKTSPAIGVCLAEWITQGKPHLMDLHPFRSTRFAEGKPWVDEHRYGNRDWLTVSR